jgi:hypothetical protein
VEKQRSTAMLLCVCLKAHTRLTLLGIYFEKIRRSVLRGRVLIYSQLIELNFLSRDFFQVFGTLEEARPT